MDRLRTALMSAAQNGHEQVARVLLEAGAVVSVQLRSGQRRFNGCGRHSADSARLAYTHAHRRQTFLIRHYRGIWKGIWVSYR